MSVETVIQRAAELGITLSVNGDRIRYQPRSAATTEFVNMLRQHKAEIVAHMLASHYQQAFQGEGPGDDEIAELVRRVEQESVVLCYAEALEDYVAFHRDDVDSATVPAGFVPYCESDLMHLFGPDNPDFSPDALKRIHQAKRTGANVTGNDPDVTKRRRDDEIRPPPSR